MEGAIGWKLDVRSGLLVTSLVLAPVSCRIA